jgi:D-glycero-alpha-D-manno-heptose-7-phosphate kinase
MIISRTPYRISFFGGGTDYPVWYQENGGEVLASTINRYCYLTCRFLPAFFEHRIRIVYSRIETCQAVDEIRHPAAREVLKFLKFSDGLEIHHDGDLPARSGIGSSSAFTVCLLHNLHALLGESPSKEQLARESILIERDILKETVGSQDQVQVSFGGLNHLVFNRDGSFHAHPVSISEERRKELESCLMLFFTGVRRSSSEIAASYIESFAKAEKGLDRLKKMVAGALGILQGSGNISEFGRLLHESWVIKSNWSDKVASREVLKIYEAAREAGALGGKLTGAGGGGFLLLFVPPENHGRVRQRLGRLIEVPIGLESEGSRILFNGETWDASNLNFREVSDADKFESRNSKSETNPNVSITQ